MCLEHTYPTKKKKKTRNRILPKRCVQAMVAFTFDVTMTIFYDVSVNAVVKLNITIKTHYSECFWKLQW
jgi:hypothetical protein